MFSINRIEYKYVLNRKEYFDYLKFINENFYSVYPSRKISSVYYDNNDLESFYDSEEGITPRKKIRIRNYNEINKFNLEIKYHKLDGRSKITKPIKEIQSKILDNQYGICNPKLNISYFRNYLVNLNYNEIRLTIDSDLEFENLHNKSNLKSRLNQKFIVELKAPSNLEQSQLNEIMPLRKERYSKYCEGIRLLYDKQLVV